MKYLILVTNSRGHHQYVNWNDINDGKEVCPECGRHYVNIGNGVLCDSCFYNEQTDILEQTDLSRSSAWA